MRILMWFTIGFGASCCLCAYGMGSPWILLPAVLAMLLWAGIACAHKMRKLLLTSVVVLIGFLAGILWYCGYDFLYLRPVSAMDGQKAFLTITATDYSYETDYGIAVDGGATIGGKPHRIRCYLRQDTAIQPGDRVEGTFRMGFTASNGTKKSDYFQSKGIFLAAYQTDAVEIHSARSVPKWSFPAALRQRILAMLEELFPADTAPFAKALLLGAGRELDYGTATAFKVSGIRHIIAVSGLHISILYALICVITFRQRFLTTILGIPLLLLFAAVSGFTPSVTRACIMVCLMMLAFALDQDYDPPTAMAFSVLVMLVVNPLAVTSVSLQMSVGCVSGILLFQRPISQWLMNRIPKTMPKKLQAFLSIGLSVPLSAMSLVTPLTAYYFGTVSLVSVLTNLLTLWAVNLVFNGLVVICLLYWFLPCVAGLLAAILAWPIRYVLWVARTLASIPLAAVYTKSVYIVVWLVFLYVLLAVFLLEKKKQPAKLLCCAAMGLCIALLASWLEPLTAKTQITMLDVGQGQSILLQSEGKTFLVDCGGDSREKTADIIAETLLSRGVPHLDGIILTHYDRDHSGAIQNLLTRVDTDYLFLPDIQNEMPQPRTTGQVVYLWENIELTFGKSALQIYGPVYSGYDNENSLCVLFDTEKCDILITGDRSAFGEGMLLRKTSLQDVDVLVAGHHGASDSTSEALLNAVTPEIVLISVGEGNLFGHPDPELLQRLEDHGCAVYRTDLNGTMIIRR